MIRSQPYITLPYLSKKSGTSFDVKVDVKNVTEPEGTRLGFLLGFKNKKNVPLNRKVLKTIWASLEPPPPPPPQFSGQCQDLDCFLCVRSLTYSLRAKAKQSK